MHTDSCLTQHSTIGSETLIFSSAKLNSAGSFERLLVGFFFLLDLGRKHLSSTENSYEAGQSVLSLLLTIDGEVYNCRSLLHCRKTPPLPKIIYVIIQFNRFYDLLCTLFEQYETTLLIIFDWDTSCIIVPKLST